MISHTNSLTPRATFKRLWLWCLCKSLVHNNQRIIENKSSLMAFLPNSNQPEVVGGNLQIQRTKSALRAMSRWLAFTFCCCHKDFDLIYERTTTESDWVNESSWERTSSESINKTHVYAAQWLTQLSFQLNVNTIKPCLMNWPLSRCLGCLNGRRGLNLPRERNLRILRF